MSIRESFISDLGPEIACNEFLGLKVTVKMPIG